MSTAVVGEQQHAARGALDTGLSCACLECVLVTGLKPGDCWAVKYAAHLEALEQESGPSSMKTAVPWGASAEATVFQKPANRRVCGTRSGISGP